MKPFQYLRPVKIKDAIEAIQSGMNTQFLAGGTNLIDLMKRNVVSPDKILDINNLPLKKIEYKSGILRIGALALNSDVANHRLILEKHPLLAMALNAGASGQLRNMATVGGNMLQKTRCSYFYDTAFPCNKRNPQSGCGAFDGQNRLHAIFGINDMTDDKSCISVHPSDMCVALAVLNTTVLIVGPEGERRIPFEDFHRLPGNRPDLDTNLKRDELVVAIEIQDSHFTKNAHYLKVRDRASFSFALVSAAVALHIEGKQIMGARIAMGGVAHKPWRLFETEKFLIGKQVSEELFRKAAQLAMQDAKALEHNAYKLELAPNVIAEALKIATEIH